jgi:predicted pyridoxine 5'-phosphate oxidase superfamily flavin-nucleotide-binding protein
MQAKLSYNAWWGLQSGCRMLGGTFVALGTVDHDGDVWATLVAGTPGFLHAPTERTLQVDLVRDPRDPASVGLDDGGAVGLLGIELHTRRRNRLNGVVSHSTRASFNVNVLQSFGNCPQYIQVRDAEFVRDPASLAPVEPVHLEHLSERARSMIETADTPTSTTSPAVRSTSRTVEEGRGSCA